MKRLHKRERKELSPQQQAFVQAKLTGASDIDAARAAGYRNPNHGAHRIANLPRVKREVSRLQAALQKKADRKTIADATEILEFHTAVMRDPKRAMIARQRAAKMLAQILGLEVARHEHHVNAVAGVVILPSNQREPGSAPKAIIDVSSEG